MSDPDRSRHDRHPEPLSWDHDTFRRLGHDVVDRVVRQWATLREQPAIRRGSRETLEALLREPMPEEGRDPKAVLDRVERDVLAYRGNVQHPRFFAFVPSPSNPAAVLGDLLTAGANPFVGTWFGGSGPSQLELVTVDWLREACGLPEIGGGLFTSGGSMANLTALAVARHARFGDRATPPEAVLYTSDQTHSAVARAVRVLGFGSDQLRTVPSDDHFRLTPDALDQAIAADRAAGRTPFCVVANAGTTNTGAVDPLPALADLCHREDLWLHVDGAYGAAAALSPRARAAMPGLERVDSLALDPHKWLFQPFEIGCVLVRDTDLLRAAFHVLPEYLRDVERGLEEVNLGNHGVQLTRSFRALKLWLTFQLFGARALRDAIDRGLDLARETEAILGASRAWEIVTPATLGIVTFRYVREGLDADTVDRLHGELVNAMVADGLAAVSSTVLHGRTVMRMCPINPRTTRGDLEATTNRMTELADGIR